MAIVDMKRIRMLGLKTDEEKLLAAIQKLGCVQVTPRQEEEGPFQQAAPTPRLPQLEEQLARIAWAIGRLQKYDTTKAPFLGGKPEIDGARAKAVLERESALMEGVEALESLEREAGELRGQASRIQAQQEQLEPWRGLSLSRGDMESTRNTVATLGTAQKAALDTMLQEGALPPLSLVQVVSTQRDLAYLYLVAHRSVYEETLQLLKQANFTPVQLMDVKDTVAATLAEQQTRLDWIAQRQAEILEETAAYVSHLPDLKILADGLASQRNQLLFAQGFSTSQRTFYMEGWVPAPMTERVERRLTAVSSSVSLMFSDATPEEDPPVLLRNNGVVQPFESVVAGFSLPDYKGLDPTAVMMPFFVNFMGMMVSDAGYGLLMAVLIPIMIKVLKPAAGTKGLMKMLAWGGVATVVWGALFNTWFGFSPWPTVFDPVNNALPVMAVCIALGAVHLFTGLGVAAYMNIKRGKPGSAVADQLSWFLVIVGLALMLVQPSIGQWVALTGVVIILCTSGREKSKNPFKRLISGLGALYGITSWVSDLLSYMRLFGMGLATGVIGMVFNQLVGMVLSAGPIGWVLGPVLFVFCHLFNAGINILGAYVHSCRLQYIEFFGKFYEDGGKPFVPLTEERRYVSIQDAP